MVTYSGKFGTPLANTAGGFENSDYLQPKLSYKFRALFTGLGGPDETKQNDLSKNITTFARPSINYEEIAIHSFNSIAYIEGKHSWNSISWTARDDVNNDVERLLGKQMQRQVDMRNQTSPRAGNDYKFKCQVSWLDGDGTPQSTWTMLGCWLLDVQFGEGSYENSATVDITTTMRYDMAYLGSGAYENHPDEIARADLTPGVRAAIVEGGETF